MSETGKYIDSLKKRIADLERQLSEAQAQLLEKDNELFVAEKDIEIKQMKIDAYEQQNAELLGLAKVVRGNLNTHNEFNPECDYNFKGTLKLIDKSIANSGAEG